MELPRGHQSPAKQTEREGGSEGELVGSTNMKHVRWLVSCHTCYTPCHQGALELYVQPGQKMRQGHAMLVEKGLQFQLMGGNPFSGLSVQSHYCPTQPTPPVKLAHKPGAQPPCNCVVTHSVTLGRVCCSPTGEFAWKGFPLAKHPFFFCCQ